MGSIDLGYGRAVIDIMIVDSWISKGEEIVDSTAVDLLL